LLGDGRNEFQVGHGASLRGEGIGIGGHHVTIVVDVANVMGSRPDGWWRDRAGAAVRLYGEVAELAARGHLVLPDSADPGPADPDPADDTPPLTGNTPPPASGTPAETALPGPGFVMVLEGAAKAAARQLSPPGGAPAREDADLTGGVAPGEVRIVLAHGSGDDTIVAVARDLPGRRYVVTADRELRRRCTAVGAEILGPGWLLGEFRRPSR
jgi:8-oxo-dGTP diphosphatase